MVNQDGLAWVSGTFGLAPRWTKDPNVNTISRIARKHLGHDEEVPINVSLYAEGAFNKLYRVHAAGSDCLMRVSLPVDPYYKTESEIATINFVRKETDMPISIIIAFDSNNQNELGFEWILMEMMPGMALKHRWRGLHWKAKEEVIRSLAKYQAQLFDSRFEKIGNIFCRHNEVDEEPRGLQVSAESFILGPMVLLIFFWGDHLTYGNSRGPFETSYEWLQSRLQLILTDQKRIIQDSDDEDDIEEAQFAIDLAGKIGSALPLAFPPISHEVESSILFHDDLSMQNILVDEDGKLTAIVDWECVSAAPLWRSYQLPQLLEARHREEEPNKSDYAPDSDDEEGNEGINMLYWDHLLEYEQTQLRKLFLDEMEKLRPNWIAKMKESSLKADFEKAVHNTDNGWTSKIIDRWLEALLQGNIESLADKLMQ